MYSSLFLFCATTIIRSSLSTSKHGGVKMFILLPWFETLKDYDGIMFILSLYEVVSMMAYILKHITAASSYLYCQNMISG